MGASFKKKTDGMYRLLDEVMAEVVHGRKNAPLTDAERVLALTVLLSNIFKKNRETLLTELTRGLLNGYVAESITQEERTALKESFNPGKIASWLLTSNVSEDQYENLRKLDSRGIFSELSMWHVRKQLVMWEDTMPLDGCDVKRTPTRASFGLQIVDVAKYVEFEVNKMEVLLGTTFEGPDLDFKYSMDARIDQGKGYKATECLFELINVCGGGLDQLFSVCKWEGDDSRDMIKAHMVGLKSISTEDSVPTIGEQMRSLNHQQITFKDGRCFTINFLEAYDYVTLCALLDEGVHVLANDFSPFSNEVCDTATGT